MVKCIQFSIFNEWVKPRKINFKFIRLNNRLQVSSKFNTEHKANKDSTMNRR